MVCSQLSVMIIIQSDVDDLYACKIVCVQQNLKANKGLVKSSNLNHFV